MLENEHEVTTTTPQSNWYKITLTCGHEVYTKVRLRYEHKGRQHHKVFCARCHKLNVPTAWMDLANYEAVTDEHVSNVLSGSAFILPKRIMRSYNDHGPNGNPFPYTSVKRDY